MNKLHKIALLWSLRHRLGWSDLRVADDDELWRVANLRKETEDLGRRGFQRQRHRDLIEGIISLPCRRNRPLVEIQPDFFRGILHNRLQFHRGERGIVSADEA